MVHVQKAQSTNVSREGTVLTALECSGCKSNSLGRASKEFRHARAKAMARPTVHDRPMSGAERMGRHRWMEDVGELFLQSETIQ
jgi:hypothetical protein